MARTRQELDLAALYRALKAPLYTLAFHCTRERSAAEDVVHDVFAALARPAERPDFATQDDARRYLSRAIVHRVLDLRRRRRPEPAPAAALAAAADDGADPLGHAAHGDEVERLRRLLLRLPAEQREVVALHLHGGLKFREVAELQSIPLDTATTRYRAALQKLSGWLAAARVEE